MVTSSTPPGDDLSTMAWVAGELQRSLENAHKSLRRYLKEAQAVGDSDVDSADVAILRAARVQFHQGVGALELVGLSIPARVLRASETAVQRLSGKPELVDMAAIETIEAASFAVLDFLQRSLARRAISSVALFPQYRAVQQLAGGDRIHPADLWGQSWRWQELPSEPGLTPRIADDHARDGIESLVLALLRRPDAAAMMHMSDFCAELGAGARTTLAATVWRLAGAFFDAQSHDLLDSDVYAKRMASRLLAQLRANVRSDEEVSERLASDLLFFCARAKTPKDGRAQRLQAVRIAWQLGDTAPATDYDTPRLGRFDPATLAQARKRVAGAKDVWSAVAGGDVRRLTGLTEPFALLGDSITKLLPAGAVLAQAMQAVAAQTSASGEAPTTALAMEMATAVLWLDAVIDEGEFDSTGLAERTRQLAGRIDLAREGGDVQPLEPWVEELYRRVSDQQTLGSVVQELRASLTEVEKQVDQYFRDPSQREVLVPVLAQLSAMRGVLSVLDLEQGAMTVVHMRDTVDALASTEVDLERVAQMGTFDRLADNLGALGFLIDMLSVQPQLAKSLFRFDTHNGRLVAATGPTTLGLHSFEDATAASGEGAPPPTLVQEAQSLAQAAALPHLSDEDLSRQLEELSERAEVDDESELARVTTQAQQALSSAVDGLAKAAARAELALAVNELVVPVPIPELAASTPVPPVRADAKPLAPGDTGLEDDAEMRDIFIEEAREVIAAARLAMQNLAANAEALGDITLVRRSFHTLKGSARMVGFRDFGEAAWACEQVYNARLAEDPRVDPTLHAFTSDALDELGRWIDAADGGDVAGAGSASLVRRAQLLRGGLVEPVAVAAPLALEPAPEPVSEPAAAAPIRPELVTADLSPDDYAFVLDDDATPALAPPGPDTSGALTSLQERLPDLPSASDLDLLSSPADDALPIIESLSIDVPADVPADESADVPADVPAYAATDAAPGFTLDLGDFDVAPDVAVELRVDQTQAPSGAAMEEAPTLPPPLGEALELDLADFEEVEAAYEATETWPRLPEEPMEALPPEEAAPLLLDLSLDDMVPAASDVVMEPRLPLAASSGADGIESAHTPEPVEDEEPVKLIGDLRIAIPLFNIFLNEADEQSRRLVTELAEWGLEYDSRAMPENAIALAHSLAGNSATVGYGELSALARALEHALMRSAASGRGRDGEPGLFNDAAEEIRRLLHQFAAGFLSSVLPALMARLADHERWPAAADPVAAEAEPTPAAPTYAAAHEPTPTIIETMTAAPGHVFFTPVDPVRDEVIGGYTVDPDDDVHAVDAVDVIDQELLPIFQEEADELLPQLQARLRDWVANPADRSAADACMRTLHTFKGGARLAGAMRVGELAHRLETAIEGLLAHEAPMRADIEPLQGRLDRIVSGFDATRHAAHADALTAQAAATAASAEPSARVSEPVPVRDEAEAAAAPPPSSEISALALIGSAPQLPSLVADPGATPTLPEPTLDARAPTPTARPIDWGRFAADASLSAPAVAALASPGSGIVRVRTGLLDRLVNSAGEVSISRARIESDVRSLQSSLEELTGSLGRMRRELRDIELQAESQISSRIEAAKASAQAFDPLEMDRFTRLQELTRMMAESVNDVATVQRGLTRTLQSAEDQLAAQSRLTRELQDDLLRTRMVEFESLAERLYRVVRLAAKDCGKQVRLDIVGGSIEVDRGVLERMIGPFEHLLRNSVVHGVELPEAREVAGKDRTGAIIVKVTQAGNEVGVEFADDGAGLDLARIRERALERGQISGDTVISEAELAQLIFLPGFSTASAVTELAGRGIGMDVVRAEVYAMGGRIETVNRPHLGASFRLVLPLTTAVTQVVMMRCGASTIAVPSTLVEVVRRVPNAEVARAHAQGHLDYAGEQVAFFWLAELLEGANHGELTGRSQAVVVIRSAAQRVALHVDEVLGNQEVVVKNLGPQLARMPALAGVTLLPSGAVALIYNPVALVALYGDEVRRRRHSKSLVQVGTPQDVAARETLKPLVMVVDDSLTVRRVTQRLLEREGYRVALAKDGVHALELLADEIPAVMLCDIEMPRMDGFELVRTLRADAQRAGIPVVMISSRIAQKHRDHAAQLGVEHYLGKPYPEDRLLALVALYAGADVVQSA